MGKEDIAFDSLNERNVGQLKLLHQSVLPVRYAESFYRDLLAAIRECDELARLVYYNDILVGALTMRIDPADRKSLYVMTLGVLAPYRRLGIGTRMLEYVLEFAAKRPEVENIRLNVQTSNDTALAFYTKHGFANTATVRDYYKRIDPPHAYLLVRPVHLPADAAVATVAAPATAATAK